jgi:chromosomal replication initiation ATPase DnaA
MMRTELKINAARMVIESYFNLNLECRTRQGDYPKARQFFYMWLRVNTYLSFDKISKCLPALCHDHSTVIHNVNTFDDRYQFDPKYKSDWNMVEMMIKNSLCDPYDERFMVLNAS